MTLPYHYTPYIWPVLASAAFIAAMGVYGWRRRSVPGALPFVILMLFLAPMTLGAAFELAAVEVAAKIFWARFQAAWRLPVTTAALCFALDYAGLGRWLTRRSLALLALPPLVALGLMVTNDAHHWMWQAFSVEGHVRLVLSRESWILTGYAYLLTLAGLVALLWLFVRSPLHRWPVALCMCGQILTRAAYLFESANVLPFIPMDLVTLVTPFTVALYAVALFRLKLFDLSAIARGMMIEQMYEGMLVLDTQQRIIDLNPAAEKILELPAARARQRTLAQVLPDYAHLVGWLADPQAGQSEISRGTGRAAQVYTLHRSELQDPRGVLLGHMVLFQDVTEQKHAQARLVEQQRAMAMLEERERLARELHDGQAQVLGYVKMRAQVARELLAQGQAAEVDAYLANLVAVAQDAHADVREYLLGVKAAGAPELAFLDALERYLHQFSQNYGLRTELHVPPDLGDVEPTAQLQLLRIIQEALTNARKHAHASRIHIEASVQAGQACFTIQDDGQGFDPGQLAGNGPTFGLRFMRKRAEEVGGSLELHSTPGQGTRVVVRVPLRK
ncbi:MAG: PAS domain-containing protein [Thermoflexales bacterium]|nr:PAS domain-containing protein [Thermoflexales bacterium]